MENQEWMIRRWMSVNLVTVRPNGPLMDAFELMQEHRIRHIPVVEKGKLIGIISDRDIRAHLPTRPRLQNDDNGYFQSLMDTKIKDVMTENVMTVTPDWPIREAAQTMVHEKISALPVVEGGRLVGIVSAEDLLWAFADNTDRIPAAHDA